MEDRTWMSYEHKFVDACASVASGDKFKKSLLVMKAELSWKGFLFMGRRQRQSSMSLQRKELSSTRKILLNPLFVLFGVREKNQY